MFRWLHYHTPHFFARHLSLGLEELYVMVGLNDLALSAIMVFEPIYLYGLGFSLAQIAFFYAVVYFGYTLLVPLGGQLAARIGYPRTILLSSLFLIGYYLSLFSIALSTTAYWVAAIAFAIQKSLYWPAFESDFVRYAHLKQEGKELSGILSLSTIVTVIGPFVGGLLIKFYGFPALFAFVVGLVLLSNLPLFFSRNPASHEPVAYAGAWHRLADRKHRRAFFAYLGFGEELIVLVFWPIAISLVVRSFASLGLLVALATLVTAVVTLYIGKLTDQHRQPHLIRLGSVGTSLVWLARLLATNPLTVFLVDTGSRVFKSVFYVPLLELTFARASREGPLKTIVFFEQSLALGKLATALIFTAVFSLSANLQYAFVFAAVVALLYRSLARR